MGKTFAASAAKSKANSALPAPAPGLVQPVLQMVSSDFVGRKEDSATLRSEGDGSFSRFLC